MIAFNLLAISIWKKEEFYRAINYIYKWFSGFKLEDNKDKKIFFDFVVEEVRI